MLDRKCGDPVEVGQCWRGMALLELELVGPDVESDYVLWMISELYHEKMSQTKKWKSRAALHRAHPLNARPTKEMVLAIDDEVFAKNNLILARQMAERGIENKGQSDLVREHRQCAGCSKREDFLGDYKACPCKTAHYCGQSCQNAHWAMHKPAYVAVRSKKK